MSEQRWYWFDGQAVHGPGTAAEAQAGLATSGESARVCRAGTEVWEPVAVLYETTPDSDAADTTPDAAGAAAPAQQEAGHVVPAPRPNLPLRAWCGTWRALVLAAVLLALIGYGVWQYRYATGTPEATAVADTGQAGGDTAATAASRQRVSYQMRRGYANQYNNSGRSDKAEQLCRELLQEDSRDASVWCELGIALSRQNKTQEMTDAFQRCLELDPQNAIAQSLLRHRDQATQQDALATIELRGLELRRLAESGKGEEAEQQARALVAAYPDGEAAAAARLELASVLALVNKKSEAYALASEQEHDTDVQRRMRAGNMVRELQEYASPLTARRAEARALLAQATLAPGKYGAALTICQRALVIDPECDEAYMTMSHIYRQQGMIEQADATYQRFQQQHERNAKRDLAERLAARRAEVVNNPRDLERRLAYADCFRQNGKLIEAGQQYQIALTLTSDPAVQASIRRLIEALQRRPAPSSGSQGW